MNASAIETAKRLLKSAAKAVDQLEEDVRELVAMRAWEVLGYENFSEMWLAENGFECPTHVKVLAVDGFRCEGLNTVRGSGKPNGHLRSEVARQVGLTVTEPGNGKPPYSSQMTNVVAQLEHGVPADKVALTGGHDAQRRIEKYGTRSRSRPRRLGKSMEELVQVGVQIVRRDDDAMEEVARGAHVPKAEIYRQAVAEYLMRHRESKGGAS